MRFTVIVPVLNGREFIVSCLPTIIRAVQKHGDAELIVVDNGSTDGSYELLQRRFSGLAMVDRVTGVTVGGVRNFGASLASGEVLVFLDVDFSIPQDYLSRVERVLMDQDVTATGSHCILPDRPSRIEQAWNRMYPRSKDRFVHYIPSGSFVVRREAYLDAGGFSETLITGEDSEFCQRLRVKGYRIFEASALAAVHHGNAKTLASFFRKEVWRGLGMFGTVGKGELDKPTLMLLAFLGLSATGVLLLAVGVATGHPWLGLGALFACGLSVPVATAGYRWFRNGRITHPLMSVTLYFLYYAARARALVKIWCSRFTADSLRTTGRIDSTARDRD